MPLNSRLQLQVPHRGHAPNNRKEVLSHEETHLLGSGGPPAAEPCRLRGKLRFNPSGSSGDSSSSADPAQPDAFSHVTTEAEVRALYGDDASLIISIEAYQGDFLVKLGTDEDCPSLDWVYGQSGIRRRMLWLDTPLLRCEIESQASVRVVTGGPNIYNGVPGFPRVELATLSLLYDEQGRDRGYDPYVSPGIGSSEIYWAGAGERYSMGMQGRREAIRSAQIDAGGLTVAFAPLADGGDFVAAYCGSPIPRWLSRRTV